ncbi:MAG: carboxy-S-adenosyl-L-methionine synthase CmoA [bacterium]
MNSKDQIYQHSSDIKPFEFNQRVVDVFPDMIQRSVPGYSSILEGIGVIAERYAQANSHCYDLGCSLGAASFMLRHHIQKDNCDVIAVDCAEAMVQRAQKIMQRDHSPIEMTIDLADISDYPVKQASIVVMNFTLQFIARQMRDQLIQKIYDGLLDGGVLVLSEKVSFEGAEHQDMIDLHHDFKRSQGYSDMEIAGKRQALEKVLIPESIQAHQQRLYQAGFKQIYLWFRQFNFVSFLAIK